MGAIETGLLVVYFISLLVVAITSAKKKDAKDFLLANRDLGTVQSASTIGASWFGAGIMISYTAMVYRFGASAIWFFIGSAVGFMIFYHFAIHLKRYAAKKKFFTMADYFYHRFGAGVGKVIGILILLITSGWVVINFIGGGQAVESYTGLPSHWSIVLAALVIWSYMMIGGFSAVVKTDVIQSITILALFLIVLYMIARYGGTLRPSDFNIFDIPPFEIVSFFLAGVLIPLGSAELWQRVYAARSEQVIKKSITAVCVFFILIGTVMMLIGMIIRQQLPNLAESNALVEGFRGLLSPQWSALALVVLFAAVMSSADSYLFAANSSLVGDILFRNDQQRAALMVNRLVLTILTFSLGFISIYIGDVVDITFMITALMLGLGLLVLIIWRSKYRLSSPVFFAACLVLFAIIIGVLIIGFSFELILFALSSIVVGYVLGMAYDRLKK